MAHLWLMKISSKKWKKKILRQIEMKKKKEFVIIIQNHEKNNKKLDGHFNIRFDPNPMTGE